MKRFLAGIVIVLTLSSVCFGAARPKGTTRFQTLSAQKSPLPSAELDNEFNTVVTAINGLSLNQQSSEWFDPSLPATYVSGTQFTVVGDKTADFLATRRIKFDVTGSSVYSEIVSATYSSGPNTTTVTIADAVLVSPIIKTYYGVVKPIGQNGSITAKIVTGYPVSTGTTASTIAVRDSSGKLPGSITGDAATLGGYGATTLSTPNTIVQRNAAGEIVGTITGGSTTLGGYPADTGTTALTIPVRDTAGKLPGDILGNAVTATNATTHIAAATGTEHGAVSTNTGNMIVRRDASGNFSAGTITATATNSTNLNNQPGSYYQPASSAITTSNIAMQSVNYAATAGSATNATNATTATNASATGSIPVAVENGLRIVRGTIQINGATSPATYSIYAGSGFTIARTNLGEVTITFSSAFSSRPSATTGSFNASALTRLDSNAGTTSLILSMWSGPYTRTESNGGETSYVSFTAIGPN